MASLAGGAVGGWRRPPSVISSIALGLAGGVLLGAITFEMLPRAQELSSLRLALLGFLTGVAAMFAFDLSLQKGRTAGRSADQRRQIELFHQQKGAGADQVTKLGGGSAAEEVIEGISIGAGAAIDPGLALFVAGSITLDNLTEGLSIGVLAADRDGREAGRRRSLRWTGAIAVSLFSSALLSWFLLRSLPDPVLGLLIGAGGGGMLYLTVTDLVPEAQERQYQQSAALAAAVGVAASFVLSRVV